MTATQSLESHFHCCITSLGLHLLIVEGGSDIDTAGTTDNKLAPMLRVEVAENVAMEFTFGQVVCSIHTGFLVSGDKTFHWTVLECLVFHNCHDGSHTQTVVSTE